MSKISMTSKRHFTVVMGNKENGLYISSRPSSAAKKAVTKLCASNKRKKVEFHIREITRDSKKKTYGPYIGYLEKLDKTIKLKEYMIKYNNPVVKLKKKSTVKKLKMRGGTKEFIKKNHDHRGIFLIEIDRNIESDTSFNNLLYRLIHNSELYDDIFIHKNKKTIEFTLSLSITPEILSSFLDNQNNKNKIIEEMKKLRIKEKIKINLQIPYFIDKNEENVKYVKYVNYPYMEYDPTTNSTFPNNKNNSAFTSPFQTKFTKQNQSNNERSFSNNNEQNCDYRKRYFKLLRMIKSKTILEKYLNNALKYFLETDEFKALYHIFYYFLNKKDDPIKDRKIISVGSGNAYFEDLFGNIFDIPEIICIDPILSSFLSSKKESFIKPKFSYVDELISSNNRNSYKDSLLILNWIHFDSGPYDVDAIKKLNPFRIFTIYEDTGAAGSNDFHNNFKDGDDSIKHGYKSIYKRVFNQKLYFDGNYVDEFMYVIQSYERIK
jgi:hypothetical protein